jgi:transposase-like protein
VSSCSFVFAQGPAGVPKKFNVEELITAARLKNSGLFPSDEAVSKLLYLALRNITKKWQIPAPSWRAAATQFAIQFGSRFFHSANC